MPDALNPKNLGLSIGIIWGLGMLLLGLFATFLNWGGGLVQTMSSLYIGYDLGIVGSVIGGIWGFVDGFIFGFLIALVYNMLEEK